MNEPALIAAQRRLQAPLVREAVGAAAPRAYSVWLTGGGVITLRLPWRVRCRCCRDKPDEDSPCASSTPHRSNQHLALFRQHLAPYVDVFMAETHSSIAEAWCFLDAFADCGKPVWLSLTLEDAEPVAGQPMLRFNEPEQDSSPAQSAAPSILPPQRNVPLEGERSTISRRH